MTESHQHTCPSCQLPCDCQCDEPKLVHAVCTRCLNRHSPAMQESIRALWPIAGEPVNPIFTNPKPDSWLEMT